MSDYFLYKAFLKGFVKEANGGVPGVINKPVTPKVTSPNVKTPNVPAPNVPAPNVPAPNVPAKPRLDPSNFINTKHKELPLPPEVLKAFNQVEASGLEGIIPGSNDNGRARGPLQIHKSNYADAVEWNPSLTNNASYLDTTNRVYASKVMQAYFNRYNRDGLANTNVSSLARTWNGGPKGNTKPSTLGYADKILKAYTSR